MKKIFSIILLTAALMFVMVSGAAAHFGMLIPSKQVLSSEDAKNVEIQAMFAHPFEQSGMNLEKPARFGVFFNGETTDILGDLKPATFMGGKSWSVTYPVKRPGVYQFFMVPKPYWEPAEDCYIVHYTKVILSAFGLEDGWDEEIGLKTEIVPLTRPFGLYAGNVFQGIVKIKGQPVPYAEVEVEFYNGSGGVSYTTPNDSLITQVIKADQNGVFTYAAPCAGWWGFAALGTDDTQIKGKDVEIGAVIWVKFENMR